MNKKVIWMIIVVVLIVLGIFAFYYNGKTPLSSTQNNVTSLQNATYIIEGQPVTLSAGGPTRYFGNEATYDFNGDGKPDTAFIITQNNGGSGTFYYVVVALSEPNGYIGTNGILLGDRIAPQTTEIKNGQIIVNYADRGANEAMTTAPHIGVSKYFIINGNQLIEIANTNTSVTYQNTDYGFTFALPLDWQGYSIIQSVWQGNALTSEAAPTGPKLIIRNPNWTEATHYEDIPILVFTISEWNSYLAENFSVSAAPIPATELARNNKYVFALPPRWDFDYSLGFKEAENIIANKPLHAFNL